MGKDKITKEVAEGVLHREIDDGWILSGEGSRSEIRICDLFPEFKGKRVRVTVEVIEDQPTRKER